MNRSLWIASISVVVLVTACLGFLLWSQPSEESQRVSVQVKEGYVRVVNDSGTVELGDGDRAVVEPGQAPTQVVAVAEAAPEEPVQKEEPKPTETPVPAPKNAIRLVDALGDPVPGAVLNIDGAERQSPNAEFSLDDLSEGTHTIAASAPGFLPVEQSISIPVAEPLVITMEYECAFEILVEDKDSAPVPGADVLLYEGYPVPRPVADSLTVAGGYPYPIGENGTGFLTLRHADGRIRIAQVKGTPKLEEFSDRKRSESLRTETIRRGDEATGFIPSRGDEGSLNRVDLPVRTWDAVAALCLNRLPDKDNVRIENSGMLLMKRGSNSFLLQVYDKEPSISGSPVVTAQTDATGKCRFDKLPPRVYYAIAQKQDARGFPSTLSPTDRLVRIRIQSQQENLVRVEVRRHDFSFGSSERPIENADLRLQGKTGIVIISATTDRAGRTELHSVPWGEYRLTAVAQVEINRGRLPKQGPPESRLVSNQTDLSVREPVTCVTLYLDDPIGTGPSVSGVVLRADTKEPVPGYPLMLTLHPQAFLDDRPDYRTTQADENGAFVFTNVPPGHYWIASIPFEQGDGGLAHISYALIPGDRTKMEPQISVEANNIEGIQYLVKPVLQTTLMGTVVDESGKPVPDAIIDLRALTKGMLKPGELSDENGEFELTFLMPEGDRVYETDIGARVMDKPFEKAERRQDGEIRYYYEKNPYSAAEGRTPVKFRGGQMVGFIRIVLKNADRGHVLYGRIVTEEGKVPQEIRAYHLGVDQTQPDRSMELVMGNQLQTKAWIEEDGSYRIERINPGPFRLYLFQRFSTDHNITLPPPVSYAEVQDILQMPEDQQSIQHDIVVIRNSYIQGQVVDQNGKVPEENILVGFHINEVRADPVKGGPVISTYLNSKKEFLLRVPPNREYNIKIKVQQMGEWKEYPLATVTPPVENLVLQLPKKE